MLYERRLDGARGAFGDFLGLVPFDDAVGGEDAAPLGSGVEESAWTDEGAGVDDTVAADFCVVADHCAELAESGRLESALWQRDEDFFSVEADV